MEGNVVTYKARLVAKGYCQRKGVELMRLLVQYLFLNP